MNGLGLDTMSHRVLQVLMVSLQTASVQGKVRELHAETTACLPQKLTLLFDPMSMLEEHQLGQLASAGHIRSLRSLRASLRLIRYGVNTGCSCDLINKMNSIVQATAHLQSVTPSNHWSLLLL